VDIEVAVRAFVEGFTSIKSRVHPYVFERFGPLWVMKDGPGRKNPRVTELVSFDPDFEKVLQAVRELGIGWHFLSYINTQEESIGPAKSYFKSVGYSAKRSEGFFTHSLSNIPIYECNPPVNLLGENDLPIRLKWTHLYPKGSRAYAIWDDATHEMIGRVQSIPAGNQAWVSDLYVSEGRRGEGFGRALMSRLLQDDRVEGVQNSVLMASAAGSRLYPHLGYERIGTLQLFCPKDRAGLTKN